MQNSKYLLLKSMQSAHAWWWNFLKTSNKSQSSVPPNYGHHDTVDATQELVTPCSKWDTKCDTFLSVIFFNRLNLTHIKTQTFNWISCTPSLGLMHMIKFQYLLARRSKLNWPFRPLNQQVFSFNFSIFLEHPTWFCLVQWEKKSMLEP